MEGGTRHPVPLGSCGSCGPADMDQWPSCLRGACVVPDWVTKDVDVDVVDEFVYWVYGMELAILMMCMRHEQGTAARGQAGLLFPDAPTGFGPTG